MTKKAIIGAVLFGLGFLVCAGELARTAVTLKCTLVWLLTDHTNESK